MASDEQLFNARLPKNDDHRLVPRCAQEFDKIGRSEPGGAGVDQRMEVEPLMAQHLSVEHDRNALFAIVDRAERRHRARLDPPDLFEQFGGAKRNSPLRANLFVHALKVDDRFLAEHEQENTALLVFDEQVLGMSAGNVAAQSLQILDREQRRMLDRLGRDAEVAEIGEQVFGRGGHCRGEPPGNLPGFVSVAPRAGNHGRFGRPDPRGNTPTRSIRARSRSHVIKPGKQKPMNTADKSTTASQNVRDAAEIGRLKDRMTQFLGQLVGDDQAQQTLNKIMDANEPLELLARSAAGAPDFEKLFKIVRTIGIQRSEAKASEPQYLLLSDFDPEAPFEEIFVAASNPCWARDRTDSTQFFPRCRSRIIGR